jgi:pimeloyl-ACP methyl ester carboxylesterase
MGRLVTYRTALLAGEGARCAGDLAGITALWPLLAAVPRGDGHAVLVLPGWLTADVSTALLRRYLRLLGYRVHGWQRGVNRGPTLGSVAALRGRLGDLSADSGPVTVIGWSLGGLYALELARRHPAQVRQVITLGTPVVPRTRAMSRISHAVDRLGRPTACAPAPRIWHEAGSVRSPVTSVYSRTDAVVAWQRCLLSRSGRRQNIEVRGSHLGLGHNVAVLYLLADRLALPADRWRPFKPAAFIRPLFPRPRAG